MGTTATNPKEACRRVDECRSEGANLGGVREGGGGGIAGGGWGIRERVISMGYSDLKIKCTQN